ncbi:zf-HC2 domain-containing protein [Aldersonia sp. NBC_00410]|uniref:anti-sigma factor family protein n=1 Tax=Aldersonia sp. NBC_00410 TaxID=2975954 RepID=UPI0022575864|nr:zf-HC2 domain-containing protein [Aldersonia sp. NBC_00410]MCX5043754.1 zf-HC2 domain-containing protein [Aldersonia sp. NBC_00410]
MTHGEFRGWSPSPFDPHDGRRFGSTDHLASEAIAAYVDGELRMNAYMRAANHLAMCPECAAEVEAQRQASRELRHCAGDDITMPNSLFGLLSRIPLGEFPACAPDPRVDGGSKRWTLRRRK